MPVTVAVNNMTVVHKDSGGTVSFMPDVCLTPGPPGPPVPIPYPNMAMSQDTSQGTSTVTCDGNPVMVQGSCFAKARVTKRARPVVWSALSPRARRSSSPTRST